MHKTSTHNELRSSDSLHPWNFDAWLLLGRQDIAIKFIGQHVDTYTRNEHWEYTGYLYATIHKNWGPNYNDKLIWWNFNGSYIREQFTFDLNTGLSLDGRHQLYLVNTL